MSQLNLEGEDAVELVRQWHAVVEAFLVSQPDWPGGDSNRQRVLAWITEHDLADATDKNAVLRLAVTELTSAGRIKNSPTADLDVSEASNTKGWVA
jgi:hypothetical protein